MSINQKGFALVEGLLILVIVAIIGGAGYFVYQAQNKSTDNLNQANLASNSPVIGKKKANGSDYLVIKEWGVKVPLSAGSKGAYYKFAESTAAQDAGIFVNVMNTQADAITGPGGTSCKGEYIAILMRLKKDDSRWNDPAYIGGSRSEKEIGDYKFSVATLKQYIPECFNKNKSVDDMEKDTGTADKFMKFSDSFVEDFKGLQTE